MCANRQIMNIVARIEQIKSRSGVTLDRLLRQAGIGYGRFMRWKRRIVAGDLPVKSPGPKKVERFDFDELTEKVDRLCHGKKRTQGPGELYESYKRVISRREFNQMVNPLRRDRQRDRVPLYVRSAGSGPTSSGPLTAPCIRPNLPTKIRMFRIFRIYAPYTNLHRIQQRICRVVKRSPAIWIISSATMTPRCLKSATTAVISITRW